MSDTNTANYNWVKPAVGGSNNSWGTKVNADLDGIDAEVFTANTTANTVTGVVANVGQYMEVDVSAFNSTSYGVFYNLLSMTIPANEDWDIWGEFVTTGGVGGTVVAAVHAGMSTTTGGVNLGLGSYYQLNSVPNSAFGGPNAPVRANFTAATPVYFNIIFFGSGGTSLSTNARMYARRWK